MSDPVGIERVVSLTVVLSNVAVGKIREVISVSEDVGRILIIGEDMGRMLSVMEDVEGAFSVDVESTLSGKESVVTTLLVGVEKESSVEEGKKV